jgi:DNA-binding PadR family transcriptional regulator
VILGTDSGSAKKTPLSPRDYSCKSSRVSSIRIFILGALEERGPMHGHQLRLLAEEEHVGLWTDISVGGLYGVIKRLAAEDLIEEVRVERAGAYPERQVWAITEAGCETLGGLRLRGLREIVMKPDPFDVAMTRLDPEHLEDLPPVTAARIASLSAMLIEWEAHAATIDRYLTVNEKLMLKHRADRLRTEIAWHEELSAALPQIISDERAKTDKP